MNQITMDILIFAVIALFLFFKLRSVLGEVDEADQNKPTAKQAKNKTESRASSHNRLNKLNPDSTPGVWPSPLPDFKLVKNATAHNALLQIHTAIPQFDPYHFLDGAKRAFPMIIEAFSKGDKKTLQNLLSKEIYEAYAEEIDARQKRGETWESELVDLTKALVSDAEIDGQRVTVTVDFEAQEKITARNAEGNFIDGQNGEIDKTEDRWSFTKDMKAKTHIWVLSDTKDLGEV